MTTSAQSEYSFTTDTFEIIMLLWVHFIMQYIIHLDAYIVASNFFSIHDTLMCMANFILPQNKSLDKKCVIYIKDIVDHIFMQYSTHTCNKCVIIVTHYFWQQLHQRPFFSDQNDINMKNITYNNINRYRGDY